MTTPATLRAGLGEGDGMDETWRKSSYSASSSECVDVARRGGAVLMRDSKDPDGPVLSFSLDVWREFVAQVPVRDQE